MTSRQFPVCELCGATTGDKKLKRLAGKAEQAPARITSLRRTSMFLGLPDHEHRCHIDVRGEPMAYFAGCALRPARQGAGVWAAYMVGLRRGLLFGSVPAAVRVWAGRAEATGRWPKGLCDAWRARSGCASACAATRGRPRRAASR